ncbi:MAG: CYTH domain-containing protein [Chloroflexota bacterium]
MGTEIERKFLVKDNRWQSGLKGVLCRQGYLTTNSDTTVRVRIKGDRGYLTIKGPSEGLTRAEYEYEIPIQDAIEMLNQYCVEGVVEKERFMVSHDAMTWEIDVFKGQNEGLILAEVELIDEEQVVAIPEWVGEEVSHDPQYRNAYLAQHPYCNWTDSDGS